MAIVTYEDPVILDTTGQAIVSALEEIAAATGGGGASSTSIAPIESTTTASKAYAVGDLLFYNNILYKVTSAISQGGTITISGTGANVTDTNVDTELKTKVKLSSTSGLLKNDGTVDTTEYASKTYVDNAIPSVDTKLSPTSTNAVQNKVIANLIPDKGFGDTWTEKTWSGLTNFDGDNIWTDGENIYYSNGSSQYVLDKNTNTWNSKTWNGLTNFDGDCIWTDGENIYYSSEYDEQYVLNKSTSTWNTKTWNGLAQYDVLWGLKIWTDEENIYYSDFDNGQYVLDKSTSTWNTKTWNGLSNPDKECIWTDGTNIYYSLSDENAQYVLDKSTSTWNPKTWNGFGNPDGFNFWTDGENIYYSDETSQYVLDKTTSTLNLKTWSGLNNFRGFKIWNDGENIYLSNGSTQYSLSKEKGFGTSASKDFTESVTNGSGDLVTSGAVASALNNYPSSTITSPANKQILEYNSTSAKWENKNKFTALTDTLDAGETELAFTNAAITSTARFETYTEDVYLPLIDIVRDGTTLTLTFPEQEEDVNVKVLIYED